MIAFIIGLVVGVVIGVLIMALLNFAAVDDAKERLEGMRDE